MFGGGDDLPHLPGVRLRMESGMEMEVLDSQYILQEDQQLDTTL